MLLFIRHRWWIKTKFPLFQYISCYCLSYQSFHQAHLNHISIHLMLLFIPWHSGYLRTLDGISIHLMLLFIGRICRGSVANIYFNTSHVTVYRRSLPEAGTYTSISIHLMLLFIQKEKRQWRTWIYFNTSHVTVYQQISVFDSSGVTHFNTSHVTVYHVAHGGYNAACLFQYISCYCLSLLVDSLPCPDHISIHLMLLFIA